MSCRRQMIRINQRARYLAMNPNKLRKYAKYLPMTARPFVVEKRFVKGGMVSQFPRFCTRDPVPVRWMIRRPCRKNPPAVEVGWARRQLRGCGIEVTKLRKLSRAYVSVRGYEWTFLGTVRYIETEPGVPFPVGKHRRQRTVR